MATAVKRLLVGRALRTEQASHERLTKKTALAVFSSDALSSTAYATEEILLVLAVAAASVVYAFIRQMPTSWWLPTGAVFTVLIVGLTNLVALIEVVEPQPQPRSAGRG